MTFLFYLNYIGTIISTLKLRKIMLHRVQWLCRSQGQLIRESRLDSGRVQDTGFCFRAFFTDSIYIFRSFLPSSHHNWVNKLKTVQAWWLLFIYFLTLPKKFFDMMFNVHKFKIKEARKLGEKKGVEKNQILHWCKMHVLMLCYIVKLDRVAVGNQYLSFLAITEGIQP